MSWHEKVIAEQQDGTSANHSRAQDWYERDVDLKHPLVSETTERLINQLFSPLVVERYRDFKKKFLTWLIVVGKNYQKREGYAPETVKSTHYKVEDIFRWKWKRDGEFSITFDTADGYDYLAGRLAATNDTDRTYTDYEKAINRFHKYERIVNGKDYPALDDYIRENDKPSLDFNRNDTTKTQKDKLHKEEQKHPDVHPR